MRPSKARISCLTFLELCSKIFVFFIQPNYLSLKKISILILLAFICGCKKPEKVVTSSSSYRDYQIGDSLFRRRDDLAFYYYGRVASNSSDRLLKAGAYNRMATIQFNSGDYSGSQETVIESQELLDEDIEGDRLYFFSNYNLLGRSYLEQKNYDAAIDYFEKADKLQEKGKLNSTLLNNLAVAYQKKKDYNKSKALLQFAMDSSKQDTLVHARALSNLARTKWLENPSYFAAPELLAALKLREIKNDLPGLYTSYSHLADYYFNSRLDSSLLYAKKMYQVAQGPDDILAAIEKITAAGSSQDAKDFSEIYYKLNDSLKQARNASQSQFAVIRFEAEKSKSENLRLQRDNFKQRVYLYTIIAGFIILSGSGIVWHRRRKRRIEQESQQSIREHQLKTSKKVHDVVANGLYRIMTDLEHRDAIDKEPLLDKIEVLYEQSRDISYDQPVHKAEDYAMQIHQLMSSFGTVNTKILIAGNQERTWSKLSAHEKEELRYVLQELMVNMSKHSGARKVVIRIVEDGNVVNIHYKDDGVGFPSNFKPGNGLRNTENRINNLGGTITFDSTSGLKIEISLPIRKVND